MRIFVAVTRQVRLVSQRWVSHTVFSRDDVHPQNSGCVRQTEGASYRVKSFVMCGSISFQKAGLPAFHSFSLFFSKFFQNEKNGVLEGYYTDFLRCHGEKQ